MHEGTAFLSGRAFLKRWVLGKAEVIVLVFLSHFCSLFLVDPGLLGFRRPVHELYRKGI